jgi:prevent-host-death family protein
MITMAAGEFKAKCLGLLSDVETKRETVLVTKYGRPVAKLVPLELADDIDPLEAFRFPGKIEIVGDILAPLYTDDELDEFERNSVRQLHDRS